MDIPANIIKTRLKGGALYIAIIVGIIIGIILIFFILIAKYNQRSVTMLGMDSQLMQNLKSGIEIAKSDYFNEALNGHWMKNSFSDDSIRIHRKAWGAFLIMTVTTKNRRESMNCCGLYGTWLCADTGLLVSDNSRPVGLSGNIVFKSNCYLPKAGIKPANIEGQSYINSSQNAAFIRSSPGEIPQINKLFRDAVKAQLSINHAFNQDSMMSLLPSVLEHSFSAKTIVVNLGKNTLSRASLKGNIKLIGNEVIVDNTAQLEDILIVCSKVKFKKGFQGTVHVIAQDSIVVENDCRFCYPSSFVLSGNDENSLKCIQFGDNCVFSGGVIAFNASNNNKGKVFVKLNGKSEVNGFIYSGDYIHMEGKLNASVICSRLMIKTPSAVYENHMLGCEIDPKKYADIIGVPVIFNRTGNLVCCKKL
jgi:hypothetical protein